MKEFFIEIVKSLSEVFIAVLTGIILWVKKALSVFFDLTRM